MKPERFREQVALLLDVLPLMTAYSQFALKGGTAINLFAQDMPRLSIDIDLAYLPLKSRDDTLENIHNLLQNLAQDIKKRMARVKIQEIQTLPQEQTKQLLCRTERVQIKVEVNTVIRGSLFPPEKRTLCEPAQKLFGRFVQITTLSTHDLYGGKICAALDRQHPRDLFDMHCFFRNTPDIDATLKKAVLFYLLSHNRPLSELLDPNLKDLTYLYANSFAGMSDDPVSLNDLLQTRTQLINTLKKTLTAEDKAFLLSFKQGTPSWHIAGMDVFENYPSIQWKLLNIKSMAPDKHKLAVKRLSIVLDQ